MRILQISNYYYPQIGGIEQVAQDCTDALRSDNEVKVFCFNHEKGDKTDLIDGIEVIRAGCFAKISSQSLSFSYYKLLKRVFADFQPEVVIFHYPNPFAARYLLKALKKHRNVKLILYWHLDITKQKILGKFFAKQTRKLLNKADRVLATSPNYIEGSKFLRAYRSKCEVVSCCVNDRHLNIDENITRAAESIRKENEGKTVCLAVGRHVPYKGTEYLIRASRLLDDRFRIFIAGEGPLTPSLKRLAEHDKKVIFLGKIDHETLRAYLLACDLFCFPSITKNEAFGIALAEGMYYEKPAVTFTIEGSGVNYVSLNGVTGIEAENGNVEQYAQAMVKLSEDADLCLKFGREGKERVKTFFTQEIFRNKMRQVLAATCSEGETE